MAGFWKKIVSALPWSTAGVSAAPSVDAAPVPDTQADAYWQRVYSAREKYFVDHIGTFPEDILKIGHMFGVWPGGGLYVIEAKKIAADARVYTTFGFTNPDMPASTTVSDVATEQDAHGRVASTSGTLKAKTKTATADGAAGYGYELFVLTRDAAEWPLWILQWAANAEILNDAGILARVNKYGGLTIEAVQVGENDSANLLIAKARGSLPTGTHLPNGKMELLVATVITDDEMRWSIEHGRQELLDRLVAAGIGQFSVRGRASVVR
jgi:hypothetical protein